MPGQDPMDSFINQFMSEQLAKATPDYPVIQVTGPVENPVVTNETTGEVVTMAGEDQNTQDALVVFQAIRSLPEHEAFQLFVGCIQNAIFQTLSSEKERRDIEGEGTGTPVGLFKQER